MPVLATSSGARRPGRSTAVVLAAPSRSLGIRRHAEELADELCSLGVAARVADRASRGVPTHFHLGNSTRSLLPAVARRRDDLVTLHDVVPRSPAVRKFLVPLQTRALGGHRVVVHSGYAAGLLASLRPQIEPTVIPLSHFCYPLDSGAVNAARDALRDEPSQVIAVVAGVLKEAKGVADLIAAARTRPRLSLILVGRPGDKTTRERLRDLPRNVRLVEGPDDVRFQEMLAAADVLVSFRRGYVGESSGPVVQAHQLGTPVAGLAMGSLPESCGFGDVLLDAGSQADDLLDAVLAAPLGRIPPGDPRVFTLADAARRYASLYQESGWC